MAKSTGFTNFLITEEVVTDAGIIRRAFYQEVYGDVQSTTYVEPMDVDTSTDRTEPMLEDKDISLKQGDNDRVRSTFGKWIIVFAFIVLTVALLLFKTAGYYVHSNSETRLSYAKQLLKDTVLGQDEAVLTVCHNLDDVIRTQAPKLLVFVGANGVGKTLTANLIKKCYLSEHVHDVSVRDLVNTVAHKAIIAKLDACCFNLIIIDDLRAIHLDALNEFILKLPTNYKLLTIPIFNVQDTSDGIGCVINRDDYNSIRAKIDKLEVDFELVVFHQINRDTVVNWLKTKLSEKGVVLSEQDRFIKEMLSKNHVERQGFKGLSAKLALIDEAQ